MRLTKLSLQRLQTQQSIRGQISFLIFLSLFLYFVGILPSSAHAQKDLVRADEGVTTRAALVIGNTNYEYKPLKNPKNDARDMAAALTKLGFKVTLKYDLTLAQMREAANTWADGLDGHTLALVYYSGHGITNMGQNYFVPIDNAAIKNKRDVPNLAYPFQNLLDATKDAGCPLRIFILDACRNDPLPRGLRGDSGESGLAKVNAPTGAFIAYAAGFGETASDNNEGANGLYTAALLKHIQTPGLPIEQLFKRVRGTVLQGSQNEQHPDESSQLTGEFCFAGTITPNGGGAVVPVSPVVAPKPSPTAEYMGRGDEFFGANKFDLAAASYSLAIEADPKNADARNYRGQSYYGLQQYDKALADFTEAVRLKPGSFFVHSNRGLAYYNLKQYDKALVDFSESIRLNPNFADALNSRGLVYIYFQQLDKALADLNAALRLKPDYAPALNNRGLVSIASQQYDKAITDFTEAIRFKPGFPEAYGNRAVGFIKTQQYPKAIVDLRKFLELRPQAPEAEGVRQLISQLETLQ